MKYLLDTDHLSILQRKTGRAFDSLSARMAQYPLSDFAVSTVTFHEQMLGIHAYINRDGSASGTVRGYEMMARLVSDFKILPLVSFDVQAADALEQIKPQKIRLAAMDARIAVIALSHKLILLTRNDRDFKKVGGLTIENWTA